MDCKTIYYEGGSMIVGCGQQPCKCGRLAEMFADEDDGLAEIYAAVAASDDEAPENESLAEASLRRRRAVMPDYDKRLERWLS